MQKKILYVVLIISAFSCLSLAYLFSALVTVPTEVPILLLQLFISTFISVSAVYFLNKSDPEVFIVRSVYEIKQDNLNYDINTCGLGELAKITLSKLGAQFLEIKVRHSREESQLFEFYCSYSQAKSEPELNYQELNFQIGSSFIAQMTLGLKRFDLNLKAELSNTAAQFSYVLSKMIFTSEHSRFVELSEQTLRAKTGFLANLSHEVRAPLGVILNATELVLDGLCGEVNENQKKFLSLSKKSSDHLLDLINDVLDFAKIEAGKVTPQPKPISAFDTIKDILNMLRLLAESKQIEIDNDDIDPELVVFFDKKHFRQILINLATNAVKYTQDKGTIKIWVEKIGDDHLKICIKDSGVGIAKGDRHKVFKPFERLEEEYSKQQSGVGIGLSLAKKLAEMNNSSLDFQSEYGQGSVFFLIAPLSTIVNQADSAAGVADQVKSHGETIAIIDPDFGQLEIVARYLEDLGYSILKFTSTIEAQDQLKDTTVDLLILDNQIFDEQLKSAKNMQLLKNSNTDLPVILLSSRAFIFDLERYLKAGIERCLPKPAPLKELSALCREILNRQSQISG